MTNNDDSFRIFGGSLGVLDAYRDVDVVGIEYDGTVLVDDSSGDGPWEFEPGELQSLRDDELCVYASDVPVPEHGIWDDMAGIAATRKNNDFNNVVDQRLEAGVKSVFQAAIEYGR